MWLGPPCSLLGQWSPVTGKCEVQIVSKEERKNGRILEIQPTKADISPDTILGVFYQMVCAASEVKVVVCEPIHKEYVGVKNQCHFLLDRSTCDL